MSEVRSQTGSRGVMRATLTPEMRNAIVADAVREVCELGGYDSPDDQPDLLQCKASELETCIRRALGQDV